MTNEEAIEVFLNRGFVNGKFDGDKWREAIIVISNCLEQEQALNMALRALKNEQTDGDLITEIDKLPRIKVGNSNSPTVKYCIDEVLLYDLLERYKAEKTSSWVAVDDYPNEDWECDNCGFIITGVEEPYRYCPNCGKKMWK